MKNLGKALLLSAAATLFPGDKTKPPELKGPTAIREKAEPRPRAKARMFKETLIAK